MLPMRRTKMRGNERENKEAEKVGRRWGEGGGVRSSLDIGEWENRGGQRMQEVDRDRHKLGRDGQLRNPAT